MKRTRHKLSEAEKGMAVMLAQMGIPDVQIDGVTIRAAPDNMRTRAFLRQHGPGALSKSALGTR